MIIYSFLNQKHAYLLRIKKSNVRERPLREMPFLDLRDSKGGRCEGVTVHGRRRAIFEQSLRKQASKSDRECNSSNSDLLQPPKISARMERAILTSTLLGYGILLSLSIIVVFIIWTSNVVLTTSIDGIQVYDVARGNINFFLPVYVFYGLTTTANIGLPTLLQTAGGNFALVPFGMTLVIPAIFASIGYHISSNIDLKFYFGDYIGFILFVVAFIVIDLTLRSKLASTGKIDKGSPGGNRTHHTGKGNAR